jgi:ferritin-like protein
MDGVRAGRLSRREVIAGTLGAGGMSLLAASGAAATAAPPDDGTLLTAALTAEQLSVMSFQRVIALPGLTPAQLDLLRQLMAHQQAHALALSGQLTALGRPLPAAPSDPAEVDQALAAHGMSGRLTGVQMVKDGLQVLLDVGALCEGAYYSAIGALSAPHSVMLAVQALAGEAQHAALVAQLLYGDDIRHAVPSWYVAGVR